MYINLEAANKHTIEAYSDKQIQINGNVYQQNVIIGHNILQTDWFITSIQQLDEAMLTSLLAFDPEIILIGHRQNSQFAPPASLEFLSKKKIGLEAMSIGAACRTYNVLLSEGRKVVLGVIF